MDKKDVRKKRIRRIESNSNDRILITGAIVCAVFAFLVLRLAYLGIVKHGEYSDLAAADWKSEISLTAQRGDILDRNNSILVTSANVYRVDVDLDALRSYIDDEGISMEKVSSDVAALLNVDQNEILEKLNDKDALYPVLARGIEKAIADQIKSLGYYGIIVSKETKRFYPNGRFLAQVLGTINADGEGLTGLELEYDDQLTGLSGLEIGGIDGQQNSLPFVGSTITPAINGKDVITTIDENIQYFAEEIAEKGLAEHQAKRVSITVMNPNTGEILAMASKPDYDPNSPHEGYESFEGNDENEQIQNMWRNTIVSDTYEPGSTFKVITMVAALEEGLINSDTVFECNGSKTFGDVKVHCWEHNGHGKQTAAEILQNSCNVGFMDLGEMLGAAKLNEYSKKLGFGELTNIDLPGESTGILKETNSISEIDLATIAFGQTNTVTAMQLMTAFNAVANGGSLIQPHIVKEISHEDFNGNRIVDETIEPEIRNDVISAGTCNTVKDYLMKYTVGDSNSDKNIQSYTIGGKTGTGQKVDQETGTYSTDKYLASVIALAPVDNPQVTVYITVDEPSTGIYYGGQVATPLMKELFSKIFAYMDSSAANGNYSITKNIIVPEVREENIEEAKKIIEDNGLKYKLEGSGEIVTSMDTYPGTTVKDGATITLYTNSKSKIDNEIVMPDLTGKDFEAAVVVLKNLGIDYKYEGSGKIIEQSIASGEKISKGTSVKLTLKEDSEY